jgi:hypothetical protein
MALAPWTPSANSAMRRHPCEVLCAMRICRILRRVRGTTLASFRFRPCGASVVPSRRLRRVMPGGPGFSGAGVALGPKATGEIPFMPFLLSQIERDRRRAARFGRDKERDEKRAARIAARRAAILERKAAFEAERERRWAAKHGDVSAPRSTGGPDRQSGCPAAPSGS